MYNVNLNRKNEIRNTKPVKMLLPLKVARINQTRK